jgi:hypothetical protein
MTSLPGFTLSASTGPTMNSPSSGLLLIETLTRDVRPP